MEKKMGRKFTENKALLLFFGSWRFGFGACG
jgi:hypothetical protein